MVRWAVVSAAEGRWQPQTQGVYHPVGFDLTGFWRPRLQHCPTTHYHTVAGKALPAIPVGLIACVGRVGSQHVALPLAFVQAAAAAPRPSTYVRHLVRAAVQQCAPDDVLVLDAGFGLALLQEGATRYVVRVAKNSTFPPPPTRGAPVRPLPRRVKGRLIAATLADAGTTWHDEGVRRRAAVWTDLVLPTAAARPTL